MMKTLILLAIAASAEQCRDAVCHFELLLEYRLTMSCKHGDFWYPIEIADNGTIIQGHNTFYMEGMKLDYTVNDFPPELWEWKEFDPDKCVFGHGGKTGIITINGESPGAPLEVYEDTLVHVTVVNRLMGGVAPTVHFHGFKFGQGYYWYDGVAGITQCSIGVGESFTYSFIASETGTHWYHSHASGVKMDGLMGSIIVHPKEKKRSRYSSMYAPFNWPADSPRPNVFLISDYITAKMHGAGSPVKVSSSFYSNQGSAEVNNSPQRRWFTEDGTEVTGNVVDEIFINGRTASIDSAVPLEEFDLSVRNEAHFICGSSEYGVEIELDSHFMILNELDAYPVKPTRARRIFLQPGETARVSFELIHSDGRGDTGDRSSFLLRATLSGKYRGWDEKVARNETEHQLESFALLHFAKKTNDAKRTSIREDTKLNWCPDNNIMNNPYLKDDHRYVRIQGDAEQLKLSDYYPSPDDEVFKVQLNANFGYGPSFNGKNFVYPSVPYSTNGNPSTVSCDELEDGEGRCTHNVPIPLGSIVEMTITSYNHRSLYNGYHPIHLHGNEMYVVGYGEGHVDPFTNNMYPNGSNPAFRCSPDSSHCGQTEQLDDVPLDFSAPQKRTTVTVPVNGYVVVRFKADNPGMWLMHCHLLSHLMEGQAMLLNVTDRGIPKVPDNFPTCPINEPDHIDEVKLVPIESIGNSRDGLDGSSGVDLSHFSFVLLLIKLL